jgi:hypothetical protein
MFWTGMTQPAGGQSLNITVIGEDGRRLAQVHLIGRSRLPALGQQDGLKDLLFGEFHHGKLLSLCS